MNKANQGALLLGVEGKENCLLCIKYLIIFPALSSIFISKGIFRLMKENEISFILINCILEGWRYEGNFCKTTV